MIRSQAIQNAHVSFPKFTGERIYMQKFYKEEGLSTETIDLPSIPSDRRDSIANTN